MVRTSHAVSRLAVAAYHAERQRARIQVGANGYRDASQFAEILEIPMRSITSAMGDAHRLGNPHYWRDPDNGRRVAKGMTGKLKTRRAPKTRRTSSSMSRISSAGWPRP